MYNVMMYDLCPYFTNDGTVGLFSRSDDDIYHSTYGALTESWQKFIIPAHFEDYVESHEEVKILDICYGIGYNTKTALNVFVKNYFKEKNNKTNKHKPTNIAAIYGDNNNKHKDNKKSIKNNNLDANFVNENNMSVATIGVDNIQDTKIQNIKNILENLSANNDDLLENSSRKKILIDAVDIDKVLINLSPFIHEGKKNTLSLRQYSAQKEFLSDDQKNKFNQIQKIQKTKIKPPSNKFKLKKEVLIILLEKLRESNSEIFNDVILRTILNYKKYTPFLSKYMLNFAKLYSNLGCNYNKKDKISAFLHNIYYRYISRSYKNTQNLLNNAIIDINFHKNDARQFIKLTNNKYNFIFLDAFTPSKCPALWTIQFFNELYSKLEDDGMILTYSNSAAIRNAFLQNGFAVGKTYDYELKKFIGTVAVKNKNLIEHELDDRDLSLINSKAGICFKDENFELDNHTIIKNRENEINNSNLISSSQVLKGYKNDKTKSL